MPSPFLENMHSKSSRRDKEMSSMKDKERMHRSYSRKSNREILIESDNSSEEIECNALSPRSNLFY